MKLSKKIILSALCAHFPIQIAEDCSTALLLERPVFLDSQRGWPGNRVCLCGTLPKQLSLSDMPKDCLLLLSADADTEIPETASVVHLPEGFSLFKAFNILQQLFEQYENWDNSLKEAIRSEDSIQTLLDLCLPLFGNPLLLRSSDFYLVAYSSVVDEQPELNYLADPDFSFETLSFCKMDPDFREAAAKKEPFYLPSHLSGARELCVNLFRHGHFSKRLILEEKLCPILPEQGPLLAHLAEYVNLLLLYESPSSEQEGSSLERVLQNVISGNFSDPTALESTLSEFGWNANHRYCCFHMSLTSLDRQNLTSKYLCHHFENLIPGSCVFRYGDNLVTFINLTRLGGTVEDALNRSIEFLRDSFLKAGISTSVEGIQNLYHIYQQARIALDLGTRYQNYHWVHHFEDISLNYLLECCSRELPTRMICSEKLLALKEYDRKHHSEYCETLQVYLETHLNAVQSARKLFIHRSTFLYRLERIQELVNIDFEDQNLLLYLLLSFRLLKLRGAEE